jgi:hypothetical protein
MIFPRPYSVHVVSVTVTFASHWNPSVQPHAISPLVLLLMLTHTVISVYSVSLTC